MVNEKLLLVDKGRERKADVPFLLITPKPKSRQRIPSAAFDDSQNELLRLLK
jgi:hypothetical protein